MAGSDLKPAERRKVDLLHFEKLDGRTLYLSIRDTGLDQAKFLQAQAPVISDIVQRVIGQRVQIHIAMPKGRATSDPVADETIVKPPDDPLVAEAMDLFDAVVVNVAPLAGQTARPHE